MRLPSIHEHCTRMCAGVQVYYKGPLARFAKRNRDVDFDVYIDDFQIKVVGQRQEVIEKAVVALIILVGRRASHVGCRQNLQPGGCSKRQSAIGRPQGAP